ncbi:DUF4465 domain-containing protein [Myroides fluvii]|uniref:DUF4465 domain-containing protein n=1 Tax=Myroides fluvii TaxID=2572594 RepID=UPI00131D102E|nr:DUF4465 domain-containing protein [Myroides fluvii]
MKKSFLRLSTLFVLGLSLTTVTLTSCSSDDSGVYNVAQDKGSLTAVTFQELVIDPKVEAQGAVFTWFDHTANQVISKESTLKYAFQTPGEHKISLKIERGNKVELYTYTVQVAKSDDFDYVRLNLADFDLTDGLDTAGGKIWKNTFTEDIALKTSVFSFNHNAVSEWKMWYGFTVSNSNDNSNQLETEGGWLSNQWGSMAQGGIAGKGKPFLVAYADHKPDASVLQAGAEIEIENFSAVVTLDDANRYKAVSTAVAISPWSYYGITEGDDYATTFKTGDYFALHVYGVGADMKLTATEPVTHYFVDFRNGVNPISKDWNTVDLSSLGEVKYLLFFLDTTDKNAQGYANTALYFTMDQLTVNPVE